MSSAHQLYTLINGGIGLLFVKLFTGFFIPCGLLLIMNLQHNRTWNPQHTPAQLPPYSHPQPPDLPGRSGQPARIVLLVT